MEEASRSGNGGDAATVTGAAVRGVARGDAQFSSLDKTQRAAAHAIIDARIAERAATEHFGEPTAATRPS